MAQPLLQSIVVPAVGKSDKVSFVPYETLPKGATAQAACIDPKRQVTCRFSELPGLLAHKPTTVKHRDSLVPWVGKWNDAPDRDSETGLIPRRKTSVAEVGPWIWLDIDSAFKDKADYERLPALLKSLGLQFWWYTTWSNGLPDKPGFRVRLVLLADRAQTPPETEQVRSGMSLLIAAALGLPGHSCDDKSFEWSRQFIRPVYDPNRPEHKFSGHWFGPNCVSIDAILPHGKKTAPVRDRAQVQSRPLADWPLDVRQGALAELSKVEYLVGSSRDESVRGTYFHWFAQMGNLMKSGLLTEDEVWQSYVRGTKQRATHTRDEWTPLARAQNLFEVSVNIRDTKPGGLPLGFDESGATPWEENPLALYHLARADELLRAQTVAKTFSRAAAMVLLETELRAPLLPGSVSVIKVNGGGGKSYHCDKVIAERVKQGIRYIVVSRTHQILGDHRINLSKRNVRHTTLAGVGARKEHTGLEECARLDEPEIIQIRKRNANMYVSACFSCPLKEECLALKRETDQDVEVILAPYQLIERALEMFEGYTVVIICDEEPSGPQQVSVDRDSVKRLALNGELPIWERLRDAQATVVRQYAYALTYDQKPSAELLEKLATYRGQKYAKTGNMTPTMQADDRVIGNLLAMALNHEAVWYDAVRECWYGTDNPPIWRALNNYGGVVLSATPNPKLYRNNAILSHFPIQDSKTTLRTWLVSSQANRRKLLPNGELNVRLVEHFVRIGLKTLPEGENVLVVSYRPINEFLKTRADLFKNCQRVDFIHAQMAIGLNCWSGWNVLVLGDEIAPPLVTPTGDDWSGSLLGSQFNATQSAARARTAQDHAIQPAITFIGKLPPTDFHTDNCTRQVLKDAVGRPAGDDMPAELEDALQVLLESLGSVANVAKSIDVPTETLRRWITSGKIPWRQQQVLAAKLAEEKQP